MITLTHALDALAVAVEAVAALCGLHAGKHGGRCEVVAGFEAGAHTVHGHASAVEAGSDAILG